MSRIIEITLFLSPFVGFAVWRMLFPSPTPPLWLVGTLAGFVLLMLLGLLWVRHLDATDVHEVYVPASLQDGKIIPGHAAPRP